MALRPIFRHPYNALKINKNLPTARLGAVLAAAFAMKLSSSQLIK
jgi:hypothetical protein